MNRLGIMVDTAHMSLEAVKRAAGISTTPLVLSHTLIADKVRPGGRTIDPEHAKAIADTGGAIGVWPISHPKVPADYGYFIDQFKTISKAIGTGPRSRRPRRESNSNGGAISVRLPWN